MRDMKAVVLKIFQARLLESEIDVSLFKGEFLPLGVAL